MSTDAMNAVELGLVMRASQTPSLEILQTAQEEGCWPGPRCRKVISKVELSEVITFSPSGVCALAHKAEAVANHAKRIFFIPATGRTRL
jgi:hypothetical protein